MGNHASIIVVVKILELFFEAAFFGLYDEGEGFVLPEFILLSDGWVEREEIPDHGFGFEVDFFQAFIGCLFGLSDSLPKFFEALADFFLEFAFVLFEYHEYVFGVFFVVDMLFKSLAKTVSTSLRA